MNDSVDSVDAVIVLRGVSAGYVPGIDVLAGVDLLLGSGCALLTGANGSGKSTFVELVAGTLRPRTGSVTVLGEPATSPRLRARRTVCRAAPALYPALTATEHASLLGADVRALRDRADRYGLGPWLDTRVSALSTGNARKAWLLLSTTSPVELVVLDEPFNGLDEQGVDALVADLDGWLTAGASVMVVAHDPPATFTARVGTTVGIAARTEART